MEHTTEVLEKKHPHFGEGSISHWNMNTLRKHQGLLSEMLKTGSIQRICQNPISQTMLYEPSTPNAAFEREEPRNLDKQIRWYQWCIHEIYCQGLWYRCTFWSLKITPKGLEKNGNEVIFWRYIQGNIPWFQPGFTIGFLLVSQVKCIAGFEPFPTDEVVA